MKLLTLSVSALTLLQLAGALAKDKSADPTNSSAREILAWLETVRFPSLQGCPYVRVTITETDPPAGQEPGFVRVDGFLLKDSGDDFTIFVIALQENLATYYRIGAPPFWPLTVATFEKESSKAKERAVYKILGFEAEASALKKEFRLPNRYEINTKLWDEGFGRHLSKPAAIAVFASACRQNHLKKLAAELVNGISRTYKRYPSDGEKEKPFQEFLENAISESLVWHATLQFDDPTITREQLLTTFRDLKERFPHSRHQSTIQETIKLLEPMVREDKEHRPRSLAVLTEDEKIRELIFQLRDQNGAQEIQPGSCNIFSRDDPNSPTSPASQLVKLGYAAVPQLIQALEDQGLTRSIHFHRDFYFSHYILRVGDCAQIILERIAHRSFYDPECTGCDMTSDGAVASTKQAVEKWWSEFQKKGEKQNLIDAVSVGDENSPAQAEILLQKYDESAPRAIMTGASASQNDRIRATLLRLLKRAQGDEVVTFLRRQMKQAPGLEARVAAARALFDRGETDPVTSMIQEWENAAPRLKQATWHDDDRDGVEEMIEFLANSGRTDAVKALAQSVHDVSADTRTAVLSAVAPGEDKLGLGRLTASQAASAQQKQPAAEVDADRAAQALLASLLEDHSFLSVSGGVGEKGLSYWTPRFCDFAGFVLAKRWPQKFQFHWSLYWTENDRQLHELKNIWRNENGLPLESPAADERSTVAVERSKKGSPIRILRVRSDLPNDDRVGRRLRRLEGNALTKQKLEGELRFLSENMPKNTNGFLFSAERTSAKPGFVIDVHWLRGPRRPDESFSRSDVIAGNESIQIRSFSTDEYQEVGEKFEQALAKSPTGPIAVHFSAASKPQ